jgi:hypothetical protein
VTKAFSNKAIRGQCRRRGITATIPGIPEKPNQIRHRTQRGSRINKLKGFRAVATR